MSPETLKEAVNAAKEFLKAAKEVEISSSTTYEGKKYERVQSGKNSATAKRKSMDLTNALAALRKSE
jgi:hypothetical protein